MLYLLLLLPLLLQAQETPWQVVYANDEDGNAIAGEISHLRAAVRLGYPIRVGWGYQRPNSESISVEHVAEAQFLTIMSQEHVLAQITPILGQLPVFDESLIRYRENFWMMIANTNGKATTATRDLETGKLINQEVSNRKFVWYVKAPKGSLLEGEERLY